jgi:hypothetical protein
LWIGGECDVLLSTFESVATKGVKMQNPTKGVKMQNPTKGVKMQIVLVMFSLGVNQQSPSYLKYQTQR